MQFSNRLLAALLCAASPAVYAADAANGNTLDITVVTPRADQPLDRPLASSTLITAEDIRKSQAPDVATLLRSVAGVVVSQTGGVGKSTSLYLRGTNFNQVLVLIDGVRVNSATTGATAIDQLMLDQVDHIEVSRGNLSSLYGSEAIGGVVRIYTKKGKGAPAASMSAGVGSQGTQRVAAGVGGVSGDTDFNLQLSSYKTDGVSALNPALYPNANPDKNGYRNTSVSANVGHAFNADHRISASVFGSDGSNSFDSSFGLPTDVNTDKAKLWKFAVVADDQFSEAWHSNLQLATGVDQSRSFLNGVPTAFGSVYRTTSNQASWQNTLRLDANKQLLLGAEMLRQQVSTDINPGYVQQSRQINSLLAGYAGRYDAHELRLNVRRDSYSQYGGQNTGLLGYGYHFTDAWRVTANVSTAFRAPSFNDLYYPNSGNPLLKPERSRNTELGVGYHVEGGAQFDLV